MHQTSDPRIVSTTVPTALWFLLERSTTCAQPSPNKRLVADKFIKPDRNLLRRKKLFKNSSSNRIILILPPTKNASLKFHLFTGLKLEFQHHK